MVARNRLPPWHEELRLDNGRDVLIRPIRPDDASTLRAGFDLLAPDELRQRFLQASGELSPDAARQLTRPDPRSEFVLVVAEPLPPGEALVGAIARAAIVDGSRDATFSILVSHHVAGMGLGRHLVRRLVRWARGKKLVRLHGDVLADNSPMLSLVESMGFRHEPGDSPGLVRVVLDLAPE
jgi:GNAT superfamily N-acetyltransferase